MGKDFQDTEPIISVGLIEETTKISFEIRGEYLLNDAPLPSGRFEAHAAPGGITLTGAPSQQDNTLRQLCFTPVSSRDCSFTLLEVTIGKGFHWERLRDQRFQGEMMVEMFSPATLTVINRIPLETYLESVICSEMNPASPFEFLKAHCVVSRSWLLAQLQKKLREETSQGDVRDETWTDSTAHTHFDVCADDHCQRYHGIAPVNISARTALSETRGQVLVSGTEICDTRFSKCCGGITERFSTAWQDYDFSYLAPVSDCPDQDREFVPPLSTEEEARQFIGLSPPAFCNVSDRKLLGAVLPDFDLETQNFFRWEVSLLQEELPEVLCKKTGIRFGAIHEITPLVRGASGRISRIRIKGENKEEHFGKELEIRRILSPTHLYSSAFVVEPFGDSHGVPDGFLLRGAGWGHGVGLCQVGAASMASQGHTYRDILFHYFTGAALKKLY
jgi:stage II sporulation protein D